MILKNKIPRVLIKINRHLRTDRYGLEREYLS